MDTPLRSGWHWLRLIAGHVFGSVMWLAGASLALLLASAVAFWLWASTPMALPQALRWAQVWLTDPETGHSPLAVDGARGSLTRGGMIEKLTWSDNGLTVEVQELHLAWTTSMWIDLARDRALTLHTLRADQVRVSDLRPQPAPPEPFGPPASLELPWLKQVSLPVEIQALAWQGDAPLTAGPLVAAYRYEAATGHEIDVDTFGWLNGVYRLQARVGANVPMPIEASLTGRVETPAMPDLPSHTLTVTASVNGELATPDARLNVKLDVKPVATAPSGWKPTLLLDAQVRPWAALPLDTARLTLQDINLAQFWPTGPATRLEGRWTAGPSADARGAERWLLKGELRNRLAKPWDEQGLPLDRLQAQAILSERQWILQGLQLDRGEGRLQAQGSVNWAPAQVPAKDRTERLTGASGTLELRGIDPSSIWSTWPATRVDASAQASQQADLTTWKLDVSPSRNQLPRLKGNGTWNGQTLDVTSLMAEWRGSRLEGSGQASRSGGWQGAAQLTGLAPGLSLTVSAPWPLSSGPARVVSQLDDASQFQQWSRDALTALDAAFPAAGIREQASVWFDTPVQGRASVSVDTSGSLEQLNWTARLDARLQATWSSVPWALEGMAQAAGVREAGLQGVRHRIEWQQTRFQGGPGTAPLHWGVVLAAPTTWVIEPDGSVTLQPGQLTLNPLTRQGRSTPPFSQTPALIRWNQTRLSQGWLESQGEVEPLPLSWANAWLATPDAPQGPLHEAGLSGDLLFGARWDVSLPLRASASPPTGTPRPPRAWLEWQHRQGNLTYANGNGADRITVSSGIEGMIASARLQGSTLVLDGQLQTRHFGDAQWQLRSEVHPPDADQGWQWADDAPFSGTMALGLPQLAWLTPFMPPGWRIDGAVSAQATVSGTKSQPDWRGQMALERLSVRSLLDGVDFSDGQALARLSGDRLTIERLQLRGAGGNEGGRLTGQGEITWQRDRQGNLRPGLEMSLEARQLRLLARADRRLVLTGGIRAHLDGPLLDLTGQLTADQALFLLPDETTPRLGSDVVIRGDSIPIPLSARVPFQTRLRMQVGLGKRFEVRGLGLQTALEGELRVQAEPGQLVPTVTGEVKAVRGSYRAYGQRLQIEQGLIRFNGPYDNPGLDIRAIRPHPTQKVGVEIGGSAQAPRVRLYADPDLPDSEKLAWLLLGRPASGAGAEAAVLQQAALALLSGRGGERDGSLAQNLGLDELSFQGASVNPDGTTSAAALTLGKRLTDQLYVSYSRSVTGAVGTVAVFLDVSRFITLRAQAGDDNAIDLIFSRRFDHWRSPRTIAPGSP